MNTACKVIAAGLTAMAAVFAQARMVALDLRSPAMAANVASGIASAAESTRGVEELRTSFLASGAARCDALEIGDELALRLFDDVSVTLTLSERMDSPLGGEVFLAEAKSDDDPSAAFGSAVVMRTPDGISATLTDFASGRVWNVYSTADGVTVRETDSRVVGRGCEAAEVEIAPASPKASKSVAPATSLSGDGKVNVDMLIVYDYNAADWVKDHGGMTNFAVLAVQRMNSVLANTGLGSKFAFRLAGVMKVQASAGKSVPAALQTLHAGTGAFAAVKTQRDAIGADVVSMLIDTGTSVGTTGIGYSLANPDNIAGFADWAYNVCAIRAVESANVLSHEVGHNMGAGHADTQASDPGPQLYSFSSGYYFKAGSTPYHTVMAYYSDGRTSTYWNEIPYYSSPSYKYNGVAVGDSTHDNTRTIASTYSEVSQFREEGGGSIDGGDYVASTWVTTRAEALAAARKQGKKIFLVCGRDSCYNTTSVRKGTCESPTIKSRLAAGFVLWYSNYDTQSDETDCYFERLQNFNALPGIAVIDPSYEDSYIVRTSGYKNVTDMTAFLDSIEKVPFPVTASDGTTPKGTVVSWNYVSGATAYNVYRVDADDYDDYYVEAYPTLIASNVKSTSYTDTTGIPAHEYYYAASAVVGGTTGPQSAVDSGYRQIDRPTITSITGTETSAMVSWTPMNGAEIYLLYRSTSPDAVRERIAAIWASEDMTFYTDDTYVKGQTFYYSVVVAGDYSYNWTTEEYEYSRLSEESALVSYTKGIPDEEDVTKIPISVAEAKAKAISEGKLLFILYGADWCGFTSLVKDFISSLGTYFTDNFVYCYIDGDNLDSGSTLHGGAYPTYGVFNPAKFTNNWNDGLISKYDGGVESWVAAVLGDGIVAKTPQNRTWKYEIVNNEAVVTGCEPADGELYIPSTLGGKRVTSIKDYAFFEKSGITGVTFPIGLTKIGMKAFKKCKSLKRMVLPYELTYLGQASFQDCTSLETIEVPAKVDYLWSSTFEGCTSLFEANVLAATGIGTSAFANCKKLNRIWLPNKVKQIKSFAFFSCESLDQITLPKSLTAIGEKAFKNCTGIRWITLPDSLKTLGKAAFFNTNLATVTVPGGIAKVDDYCFQKCPRLTTVTLSEGVREIGASVFANDGELTKVAMPSTLTTIGPYAFFRCSRFGWRSNESIVSEEDRVVLPDSVTSIGEKAFKHCALLWRLRLGAGVTDIPREMCNFCTSLAEVEVGALGGLKSIGLNAFANCPALASPPKVK